MAAETSGYNIIVSCSQDSGIEFKCRSKKRPGVRLGPKIDVSTDRSTENRVFEPSALFEVTNGELTVPDDPVLEAAILGILGIKGTITFRGRTTNASVSYSDAWFASYTPDTAMLDGNPPSATIIIESAGSKPTLTHE